MWLNQSKTSSFLGRKQDQPKNNITLDEDEGFSETMTSPAPQQPRSALGSIENLQNFLLLDSSFIEHFCKQLMFISFFVIVNSFSFFLIMRIDEKFRVKH